MADRVVVRQWWAQSLFFVLPEMAKKKRAGGSHLRARGNTGKVVKVVSTGGNQTAKSGGMGRDFRKKKPHRKNNLARYNCPSASWPLLLPVDRLRPFRLTARVDRVIGHPAFDRRHPN